MAKEVKTMERTYNIPLRKEYQKVPGWRRTKKAVSAVRVFLAKHMKSENVKLGKALNEKLWQHGIKNPPHHVKVSVSKDSEGMVNAELFGVKIEKEDTKKVKKSAVKKEETPKEIAKKEESKKEEKILVEKKPEQKEEKMAPVKEEKATQAVPSVENQKY
jgi:large subunit ribosomal protein L31e